MLSCAQIFTRSGSILSRLSYLGGNYHTVPVETITAVSTQICKAADLQQGRYSSETHMFIDVAINGQLAKNLGQPFNGSKEIAARIKSKGIERIRLFNPNPLFVSILLKSLIENPLDNLKDFLKTEQGFSVTATKDVIEKTNQKMIFITI
jgi:hypothetical protein